MGLVVGSGREVNMEPLLLRLGNEVRQSLHHMLGLIELTAEEPLSESQSRYLDRFREAADQLLRTASDLGELARPGEAAAAGCAFNAPEAIGEIVGLMGALAERKGLSFHWTADAGLPTRVLGEKYLLQDVLRRLLDNAIRFTAAGNIRLSATRSARADSTVLTFEVSDTGAGMPQEVLEDFDGDVSQPGSQGLSLRILRKRLADLNGAISITPNSPHGTTIRVDFPVTPAPGNPEDTAPAVNGYALPPLRLLVAEDSDDSFLLFTSFVKSECHVVSRALNGAEAVDMAKRGGYDFIVMDVNMPRMDGYTATRLIREWETEQGRARLPILLLSADDLERQVRIGGAAGCSGYLTKPTSKAPVIAALNYFARGAQETAGSAESKFRELPIAPCC